MDGLFLQVLETVEGDTPARAATSLMVSENDIMKAIHSLAGKKTVILISHRLANVVDSDCIYVLEAGRIAEQGTHNDLLAAQGVYSRLYNAQKQLEDLGEVSA